MPRSLSGPGDQDVLLAQPRARPTAWKHSLIFRGVIKNEYCVASTCQGLDPRQDIKKSAECQHFLRINHSLTKFEISRGRRGQVPPNPTPPKVVMLTINDCLCLHSRPPNLHKIPIPSPAWTSPDRILKQNSLFYEISQKIDRPECLEGRSLVSSLRSCMMVFKSRLGLHIRL